MKTRVQIKRAYDEQKPDKGRRVLVDRLWPRGIRKDALAPDEWLREVAPSDELRRWFAHETERWQPNNAVVLKSAIDQRLRVGAKRRAPARRA